MYILLKKQLMIALNLKLGITELDKWYKIIIMKSKGKDKKT